VQRLRREGMTGLILDLRRNPGGLLDQGVETSDLFLDRGKVVAEMRGRAPRQSQRFLAEQRDQFPDLPIVVLVGPASASASEILGGALQDNDRALLVGMPTFGKGSVQTVFPLLGGNYLKLTTARWYTPLGRSIHNKLISEQESEVLSLEELLAQLKDTSERPVLQTASGRTVYGGGGIYPDLVLDPDTLTTEEQAFRRATARQMGEFRDVLSAYAVRYVRDNPDLERGFVIPHAALVGFYSELREAGIEVDRELYDGARRYVLSRLGYEISYAKWGEPEARRRENAEEPEVAMAARLLREAQGISSLFEMAKRYGAPGDPLDESDQVVEGVEAVLEVGAVGARR